MSAQSLTLAVCSCVIAIAATADTNTLISARDRQDLNGIERAIEQYRQTAQQNPQSPEAQYKSALAYSFGAEVAMELYPELFRSLEQARWNMATDVPWERFDAGIQDGLAAATHPRHTSAPGRRNRA